MQINVKGAEFKSINGAVQHAEASGRGVAIEIGGRCFVVSQAETIRLEYAAVSFSVFGFASGRLCAVPINA